MCGKELHGGTDLSADGGDLSDGLHEHISVDTLTGLYAISYGMDNMDDPEQGVSQASGVVPQANGTGSGLVYEDPGAPTSVVDVLHTTPAEDRFIEQLLRNQVGNRGPYNVATNSCKIVSHRQFDQIRDTAQGPWWQRLLSSVIDLGSAPAY